MRLETTCLMAMALCGLLGCATDDAVFGTPTAGSGGSGTGASSTVSSGGAGGSSSSAGGSTSSGGGSGGQGGGPMGCTLGGDGNKCGDGQYCNAPDCMSGSCEPLPMTDDNTKAPVCGCDGVNYWNATTAARFGMSVASTGECGMPVKCGMNVPCPTGRLSCGEIISGALQCSLSNTNARGTCWGMPETCPQNDATPLRPCGINQPCASECHAIKAGGPHYEDFLCN